jgi:thiamine-phosphate pyrophosphorylase
VCAQAGWTLPDFAAACLDGGARFLQVRAKSRPSREVLRDVDAVIARAAGTGAIVIVNDRADLARLAGATGVHVGQDDLAPADVRRVVGAAAMVGLSTHTRTQLDAAVVEPVDYVAIGPVFGTRTKDTGYAAVGLEMVRAAHAAAAPRGLPVVAIGGITLERAVDVLDAGATSLAVITDLLIEGDPARRVRAYIDRVARV